MERGVRLLLIGRRDVLDESMANPGTPKGDRRLVLPPYRPRPVNKSTRRWNVLERCNGLFSQIEECLMVVPTSAHYIVPTGAHYESQTSQANLIYSDQLRYQSRET